MKSTFKVLFYLKKDKISKDGKVPVMGASRSMARKPVSVAS